MSSMTIWREFTFEAAHRLPNVHVNHKCHNMHGHSYVVRIEATGPVIEAGHEAGMIADYDRIDRAWSELFPVLDHHVLNEVPGLENPTIEVMAPWLWSRLKRYGFQLARITIMEGPRSGIEYVGESRND